MGSSIIIKSLLSLAFSGRCHIVSKLASLHSTGNCFKEWYGIKRVAVSTFPAYASGNGVYDLYRSSPPLSADDNLALGLCNKFDLRREF